MQISPHNKLAMTTILMDTINVSVIRLNESPRSTKSTRFIATAYKAAEPFHGGLA